MMERDDQQADVGVYIGQQRGIPTHPMGCTFSMHGLQVWNVEIGTWLIRDAAKKSILVELGTSLVGRLEHRHAAKVSLTCRFA